jgi:hypothetical protein
MTNNPSGSQKFLKPFHRWPLCEPGSIKVKTGKIPSQPTVNEVFLRHMQEKHSSGSGTAQGGGRTGSPREHDK